MSQTQMHANPEPSRTMLLNMELFATTPLVREPFDYIIVPGFICKEAFDGVLKDYPHIDKRGSFALSTLSYGPEFTRLLEELKSDEFRNAVAEKFSVNLADIPTMITVRGACGLKDGSIHTDTESKILSLLLYMNPIWENDGGRLRLLNSRNIEDVAAEVPPVAGTLLIFRRADNSFHGHKSFSGPRKVVQLNWITDAKFADRNDARHRISSFMKKLNPFANDY